MYIEVLKGKSWYYRLMSKNGKVVLVSETFYSKWNAKRQAKKLANANYLDLIVR